ncbi:MAG: hypothetical protein INR69_18315, partial [Mucilaginibacter polytrichastri]|nr:hypothetical protein [Mucilaginibacter polytrichastri]
SSFDAHPEILEPFDDLNKLSGYRELIDTMEMSVLPVAGSPNDLIGFGAVFPTRFFSYTSAFRDLLIHENANAVFDKINNDLDPIRFFFSLILEKCYHVNTETRFSKVIRLEDKEKHAVRFLQIESDNRFLDVRSTGEVPQFREEWLEMMQSGERGLISLSEELPAELFSMEGFGVFTAKDVTATEALNELKTLVLNLHDSQEEEALNHLEGILGTLLGDNRIKMGIAPFFQVNDEIVTDTNYFEKTILISTLEKCPNGRINPKTAAEKFSETNGPILFPVIDEEMMQKHPILRGLQFLGIKSYVVQPIYSNNGQILGALELATEHENGITKSTVNRLEPALGLITDVLEHLIHSFRDKMNNVVKTHFTPLQPSVEWKFYEAAWEYIRTKSDDESQLPNVVFDNVHPLYGAIDIRNSSTERNNASQADMLQEFNETENILADFIQQNKHHDHQHLLDEVKKYRRSISKTFTVDAEQTAQHFIAQKIYPVFRKMAKMDPSMKARIDAYFKNSEGDEGDFHHYCRTYESSLHQITRTINQELEKQRLEQQEIFPHFFEKYRTDGVEYTLYCGQSLSKKQTLDPEYIHELRLWQLRMMARIGYLTSALLNDSDVNLQTTQLVLAHDKPITINFRKDEHRFDVEGAYNVRYEVMKKRIDKINLKDTHERLTRPGTVAIVYSHPAEASEYETHIDTLKNEGVFSGETEHLDLEEMQGIDGLKAYRVAINYAYFTGKNSQKRKPSVTYGNVSSPE